MRKKYNNVKMQNLIAKILKVLKDHVSQNNQEIHYNQTEIKNILTSDELADISRKDLEYKNELNKELFRENDDFLHLQLELNEFMEKYAYLFPSDIATDTATFEGDTLPYFTKTIEGELKFRPGHPQFSNPQFFKKLLKFYEEKENYEMCDQLLQVKRRANKF